MDSTDQLATNNLKHENFSCDHKAETERRKLEDARLAEEELKNWDNILKTMISWGPKKFDSNVQSTNDYSLFSMTRYVDHEPNEVQGNEFCLTSVEASLLINDLEKRLAQLSQMFLQEDKRLTVLHKSRVKTLRILEKRKAEMDVHMPKISQMDVVCRQLFNLTQEIFYAVTSLIEVVKNFEKFMQSDEELSNLQALVENVATENFNKTRHAVNKCNEGLAMLSNCEKLLNETAFTSKIDESSKNLDAPTWSPAVKNIEEINRQLFINTGAIPKALRWSGKLKSKKRKKGVKCFVDRPPGPLEMQFDFTDDLIDLDQWHKKKITENLQTDDDSF